MTDVSPVPVALGTLAQRVALLINAGFAPLDTPTFTGAPAAPTAQAGDSSTRLATTAFVAASFAPISNPTFTGTATAPKLSLTGNITTTGDILASNAWLFLSQTISGSSGATATSPLNFSIMDRVNYYGVNGVSHLRIQVTTSSDTVGDRSVIRAGITASTPPSPANISNHIVAVHGTAQGSANRGGRLNKLVGSGNYAGGNTSLYGQTILRAGATAQLSAYGCETNAIILAGASSVRRAGIKASTASSNAVRGTYTDAAYSVGESGLDGKSPVGWESAIEVGSSVSGFPLDADSTVLSVRPRLYAGYDAAIFLRGIDFRWATVSAGGFAFGSPNFAVDGAGAVYGNGLTSSGTVQAQTATLASVSVADGGLYLSFPTWTVQGAPSGGTTATVTTVTMGGDSILGFGNTGVGFTVNDVLTASGGIGPAPTFTVAAVDGAGRITSLTKATDGAWTVAPSNPVLLTGGTGTANTAFINIVDWVNAGAGFVPNAWEFGATGNGYAVNDVLTVAGDTGTAVQCTASAVSAAGAIIFAGTPLAPGLAVTTAGSLSAVAGTTYRSVTGGTGSGASLQVGYKVLTCSVTGGAGYLPMPPPTIRSSSTDYRQATLVPTMTAVAASLSLNPAGGAIKLGSGSLGFFNAAPAAKPTVSGSRGSNAALASLLSALAGLGLLTDSSS